MLPISHILRDLYEDKWGVPDFDAPAITSPRRRQLRNGLRLIWRSVTGQRNRPTAWSFTLR